MTLRKYSTRHLSPDVDLDLSRNEGRSMEADLMGSIDQPDELIRRYPDSTSLQTQLATLHGVDDDRVLVTAGGDDALLRCFLARLGPGLCAVTTTPTFEMIPIYARQVGSQLVEIDWGEGAYPISEIVSAAAEAEAVFVVSPNNPTGSVITESDLVKLSEAVRFIVLDSAYAEFADEDLTSAALRMENVVVIRTLSKAYGLAGLRVGCLLGQPELIKEVSSFGNPYSVSSLSCAVATERLRRQDRGVETFVEEVRSERTSLARLLDRLGTRSLPSQGNFILAEVDDAEWTTDACATLGVGIRRFPDRTQLANSVRITLPGDPNDFARLKEALTTAIAPEAILFDLDGVLVDVSDSYQQSIIKTADSFGVEVAKTDIEDLKSSGGANDDWELTQRLMANRGVVIEYSRVVTRFEEIYQGLDGTSGLKLNERPLVDAPTWSRWASALPLGVVTGRPRADAEAILDRFGLAKSTSALVSREDATLKPSPRPVQLAMEQLRVRHAWLIGDTPDDIEAARSAQVVPIGVVSPGADPRRARQTLTRAARTLDRTIDLEELLP